MNQLNKFIWIICLFSMLFSCGNEDQPTPKKVANIPAMVKLNLTGFAINNSPYIIRLLDGNGNHLDVQYLDINQYLKIKNGTFRLSIEQSNALTVDDAFFYGISDIFTTNYNDTLEVVIDVEKSEPKGWLKVPNVPMEKRFGASSFMIGNNIYIGFGSNHSNEQMQDWWVYSVEGKNWQQLPDFPGGKRFACLSFSINNKGYIILGYNSETILTREFWEFDVESASWLRLADFPGSTRTLAVPFVIGNEAYVGSGNYGKKDFYKYDQLTDTWNQVSDNNGSWKYGMSSFTIGNFAHLVGGVVDQNVLTSGHKVYDAIEDSWDEKDSFPGNPRSEGIAFTLNGKGYFGLGVLEGNQTNRELWVYDPLDQSWQRSMGFLGTGRFSYSHGHNGEIGYVGFGSFVLEEFNDLFLFYPE